MLIFGLKFGFQDGGGDYNGKQVMMTSSATLTINVIDIQDTPPMFVGTPYFGYVYEVSSPVSIFIVYSVSKQLHTKYKKLLSSFTTSCIYCFT